jgi:hypothetical protein
MHATADTSHVIGLQRLGAARDARRYAAGFERTINAPWYPSEEARLNRLEVKGSKTQFVLVILLGLFFIPMGLVCVVSGLLRGVKIVPLGIGLMCLLMFGVIVWLILRAYRKSVKYLSEEGLVRNDGRSLSWSELSRVVDKVRVRPSGRKTLWRTEIRFKDGESAWVIPMKVSNYAELGPLVDSLPCEHTEERA